MRSTIIPAQITTVEDKIAGSLSMTQILLMITPVLWATLVYALFIPQMKLASYKMPLVLIASIVCFLLALRIKGKLILEWLSVLLRYRMRPKYYLFNKNSLCERQIDLPEIKSSVKKIKKPAFNTANNIEGLSVPELIKLESVLNSGKLAVNFNFKEKRL
jgi:hypothetical protein